jgi:hypothetical protein
MECRQKENLKNCNCGFECDKKGICCKCLVYHRGQGELPACYFSDKVAASYDRSVETYLKERRI